MNTKITQVNLDETFNPKDIVVSEVAPAKKCGEFVKHARAAIGHKRMKNLSAIPDSGRYRSIESYLYLIYEGTAIGIYHSYEWQQPRTPENMKGYDVVIPLVGERDAVDPGENDHTYHALHGLHQRVVKHLIRNKDSLPKQFRIMSDDELRTCIRPPYSEKYTGKDGKVRSPSWSVPIKYKKADPKAGKKEILFTKCRGPGNKPFHPDDFLSVKGKCIPGKVKMAVRVCHIGFSVKVDEKSEDGELKKTINYTLEVANLNFTPLRGHEEVDLLGGNYDPEEGGEEDTPYSKKEELVDVEYGNDEESDEKEEESEEDEQPRRRSKRRGRGRE